MPWPISPAPITAIRRMPLALMAASFLFSFASRRLRVSTARCRSSGPLAARHDRPDRLDLPVADTHDLVGQVHSGADVIRNHAQPVPDVWSPFRSQPDKAVFFGH